MFAIWQIWPKGVTLISENRQVVKDAQERAINIKTPRLPRVARNDSYPLPRASLPLSLRGAKVTKQSQGIN